MADKVKGGAKAPPRKQPELDGIKGPGVGPIQIEEIDALAATYVKHRDKRMDVQRKEITAKKELIDALKRHAEEIGRDPQDGSIRYQYEEVMCELKPTEEKLTVKAIGEEEVDE